MKNLKNVIAALIMFSSATAEAQTGYAPYPSYQQPMGVQYQLPAPQTMNPGYQLPAPQYQQPVQNNYWNRAGQWVRQKAPQFVRNAVGGYIIDKTAGQQVRSYYENRGAYCPPKPVYVPGWASPAYYVATCAYPAY